MVNYSLDRTFGALADPTRRAIVTRLAEREVSISELAAPFGISLPAVSKHVRVLEAASIVAREKRGRTTYCRLLGAPLDDASTWLTQQRSFWVGQLASLDRHLRADDA